MGDSPSPGKMAKLLCEEITTERFHPVLFPKVKNYRTLILPVQRNLFWKCFNTSMCLWWFPWEPSLIGHIYQLLTLDTHRICILMKHVQSRLLQNKISCLESHGYITIVKILPLKLCANGLVTSQGTQITLPLGKKWTLYVIIHNLTFSMSPSSCVLLLPLTAFLWILWLSTTNIWAS